MCHFDRDLGSAGLRIRRDRGARAHQSGAAAESQVARHYERLGSRIRDMRWRGQSGEVDLVAEDAGGLIFVEVKKSRSHAEAAARVSARQMARIAGAAAEYLGDMPRGQLTPMRFDVALVDGSGRIEVLENAFAA